MIVSVLLLSGTSSFPDVLPDLQGDLTEALKNGSVAQLSRFISHTVDLTLPGNEGTFSKAQAEVILKDFFSKNPPASFKMNHNGISKDGSVFYIGTYLTTQKKSYKTYCLLKKSGDRYYLQQIQFEPV